MSTVRGLARRESWKYPVSWIKLNHPWQYHSSWDSLWLSCMPFDQPQWRGHKCNLLVALKPHYLLYTWQWKPLSREKCSACFKSHSDASSVSCITLLYITPIYFTETESTGSQVIHKMVGGIMLVQKKHRIGFQVRCCWVFSHRIILKTCLGHKMMDILCRSPQKSVRTDLERSLSG